MKRLKRLLLAGLLVTALSYAVMPLLSGGEKEKPVMDTENQQLQLEKKLYSKNYILIRQRDGKVLLHQNEEDEIAPASLTKLMSVYTALQHIENLQETVQVPASIFPKLEREQASMAGFIGNEEVTYEDLIYGALLPSGADACMTLAITLYGSEDAFVAEMNVQAQRLGLKNTRFRNCTGLDEEGHVSSVSDIATLLKAALQLPQFTEAFHAPYYSMAPSNKHSEGMTIYSTMRSTMDQHALSDTAILGGKTGYTKAADLCLASQAKIGNETWLFVSAHAAGSAETKPYHILDAMNVYDALQQSAQ